MSDSESNDSYLCAACRRVREKDDVEMVADPDPKYGEYPLCVDEPSCTIAEVARRRDDASRFKVDEPLE